MLCIVRYSALDSSSTYYKSKILLTKYLAKKKRASFSNWMFFRCAYTFPKPLLDSFFLRKNIICTFNVWMRWDDIEWRAKRQRKSARLDRIATELDEGRAKLMKYWSTTCVYQTANEINYVFVFVGFAAKMDKRWMETNNNSECFFMYFRIYCTINSKRRTKNSQRFILDIWNYGEWVRRFDNLVYYSFWSI